ncbi:unnamed protein product [Bursaphelenchus xylophilus]|uniref:(pine wood nematode) hypothetical protein n=1 Tax=Bursaphelenchus xylophilus TaxID=6326 RepID=A0A1I7SPZ6_BURXY|nr:unnamed protein product [Bursaphelenchus xylophilus]CAG9109406.1 unnamed protein product [Bursaphelenchus xylophilus]
MSDTQVGLGACLVSVLCFGSMFVAIRKFQPGDGFFVQWVLCSGIFCVGAIVHLIRECPQFQPFAMIGGVLWASGNLTAVPIINAVGLGLGVLIWGVVNCAVGWAIGRFGLFGTHASIPAYEAVNYFGLFLVILGGVLFAQVKSSNQEGEGPEETIESNTRGYREVSPPSPGPQDEEAAGLVETNPGDQPVLLSPPPRISKAKIVGCVLSIFAGICYGSTFTPVIYIQDNPDKFINPSKDAIDYVFPHFTGIYLTSTFAFLIYTLIKHNQPFIDPRICLAAFFGGILWALAMLAWFVANDRLSQGVTYPINGMVPGVVATLYSVFYFREIKGKRNFQILVAAIAITLTGAAMVGLSKNGI